MRRLILFFLALFLFACPAFGLTAAEKMSGVMTKNLTLTLDDSYPTSNRDGTALLCTNFPMSAQSFTSGGGVLDSVSLYLATVGSPTGNLTATIYAHTGTYGTSSLPTGSVLATSVNFDVSTLGTNSAWTAVNISFSGANRINLTAGYYVVVANYAGQCATNTVGAGKDTSSPTHSGNYSYYDTAWNAYPAHDLIFYVYVMR